MKHACLLVVASVSVPALAAIDRTTIPVPGGFVQAGATPAAAGSLPVIGSDLAPSFANGGADFHESSFAGVGPVNESALLTSGIYSGSATAAILMGRMVFEAQNTESNSGSGHATLGGGFKENFIVTGGTPGANAWMLVDVAVEGGMTASGFAGSASLYLGAFKDDLELVSATPFWDNGNSDAIGTDRQRAQWGLATFSVNDTASRTITDMITFSVPITFDQGFNLGIYGIAHASKRSLSGVAGTSSATLEFVDGVTWVGARVVDAGGALVPGAVISSDTGLDWTNGPTACPADLAEPFGVLNFFDIQAYLALFTTQSAAADLAEPFGVFNFFDIAAYITLFGNGCP